MAYVTKKELIEKINPLIDELVGQQEELANLLNEDDIDREALEDIVSRIDYTLRELRDEIKEAED
jgi:hypothetical protein